MKKNKSIDEIIEDKHKLADKIEKVANVGKYASIALLAAGGATAIAGAVVCAHQTGNVKALVAGAALAAAGLVGQVLHIIGIRIAERVDDIADYAEDHIEDFTGELDNEDEPTL